MQVDESNTFGAEQEVAGHSQTQVEVFKLIFGAVQFVAGHSHAQVVALRNV